MGPVHRILAIRSKGRCDFELAVAGGAEAKLRAGTASGGTLYLDRGSLTLHRTGAGWQPSGLFL